MDGPKAYVTKTLTGPENLLAAPSLARLSLPSPEGQARPATHPSIHAPGFPTLLPVSKY